MNEHIEEKVKGVIIDYEKEMQEINQMCDEANIYICPDCNHHGFHEEDEGESIDCFACGKTAFKDQD